MFDKKRYNKKYWKIYYENNREKHLRHSELYRKEHPNYLQQYYKDNKDEISKKGEIYRSNVPEKIKIRNKLYYTKNKEKNIECVRLWQKNNPENVRKYRKKYRENNPEYQKQYLQTEEGKASAQRGNIKRQAKEREIINTLTSQEWLDILEAYNYRCVYCDVEFEVENMLTKDHIIPLSKGGHNTKENVVPACRSCNSKKYNKIIPVGYFFNIDLVR